MKTNTENHTGPEAAKIRSMFAEIAPSYDRANDVLSAGIHHLWRKKLVRLSGGGPKSKVLDCATGTGDLAIQFKKTLGPESQVTGTDFCAEMLIPAPEKAQKAGFGDIKFSVADVTQLPFEDQQFDIASISFGIRNVNNPKKALEELARVTKPGGKVLVLEFGQIAIPGVREVYNFYSNHILPVVGGWVTGKQEAYEYLQKSSAQFPCRNDFISLMESTGKYHSCKFHSLSAGIAYIYEGKVK